MPSPEEPLEEATVVSGLPDVDVATSITSADSASAAVESEPPPSPLVPRQGDGRGASAPPGRATSSPPFVPRAVMRPMVARGSGRPSAPPSTVASGPPDVEPAAPPTLPSESPPVVGGLSMGDPIAGKYVITEVLGRGGMGQVLAARHTELGTMVAIKVVLPEALGAEATIARFKREALAMARLRSEHAVRILDVGDANGMPFIMMEYLEGNDLASELRRRGPLPIREAVRYVLEAIDVLAEAHDLGIVHRDLKPGNMFLAWRPSGARSIRVLDFGIAKPMIGAPMPSEDDLAGRAPGKLTAFGMTLGTPHFMAPEQVSSGAIGPHTDVWGVGATLYTLLTGAFPFTGPTVSLICGAVCSLPPIAPRDRRPEIPVALEAIILKCLEKAPNKRFVSIRELAAALGHAVNLEPPSTTMGLRVPKPRSRGEGAGPAEGDAVLSPPESAARGSRPSMKPGASPRRRSDPQVAPARAASGSHGSISAQFATSRTAGSDRPGASVAAPEGARRARLVAVAAVVGLVVAGAATVELLARRAPGPSSTLAAAASSSRRLAAAANLLAVSASKSLGP